MSDKYKEDSFGSSHLPQDPSNPQSSSNSTVNLFISITHEELNERIGVQGTASFTSRRSSTPSHATTSSPNGQLSKLLQQPLSLPLRGSFPLIKELADDWSVSYNSNPLEAIRSILELILHTSGFGSPLYKEKAIELNTMNKDTFDLWMNQTEIRPLYSNPLYLTNVLTFFELALNNKMLLSKMLMLRILQLISLMAHSQWTTARYTAVLIGSEVSNLYLNMWMKLTFEINDGLPTNSVAASEEKLSLVRQFRLDFESPVLVRLRDVDLLVRKIAFEALYHWIINYPDIFIKDVYLQNIYWAFFDSNSTIRLLAVKMCGSLIISHSVQLNLFVEKTMPLLFLRTCDIFTNVAVRAVKTLISVQRVLPDIFKFGSGDRIYKLVYCNRPELASAATLFLYKLLKDYHTDSVKFLNEIIIFLNESEMSLGIVGDICLIRSLMAYAEHQLTDWSAWSALLLGNRLSRKPQLPQVACRLLSRVIILSTTGEIKRVGNHPPLAPRLIENPTLTREEMVTESAQHKEYKAQITTYLGPRLVLFLEKYKHSEECLKHLLVIPKHFSEDINNLDMKLVCSYMMTVNMSTSILANESLSSLAFLRQLMLLSQKWKHSVPILEKCLFTKVVSELKRSCERIQTCPIKLKQVIKENMLVLRKVYYLTKYFDMTQTEILHDSLIALQYAKKNENSEIFFHVASISLHITQWQWKNILEHKYSEEELKARMYKLQSHIYTLVIVLEHMMYSDNVNIKGTAFTVMRKLFTWFCLTNNRMQNHPLIHLPQPSYLFSEWFNYHLYLVMPYTRSRSDRKNHGRGMSSLREFCVLLSAGVLDISYMSSLLPYFTLYQKETNCNTVLQTTFRNLVLKPSFSSSLVQVLDIMMQDGLHDVKEMISGFCSVVLSEWGHPRLANCVAKLILYTAFNFIKKVRDSSLLLVLLPLINLLSTRRKASMKRYLLNEFYLYLYDDVVKHFVMSLDN